MALTAREEARLEAELEALEDDLKHNPARKMVKYLKRSGGHKGHFVDLTPLQYRSITGKPPKKSVLLQEGW